MSLWLFLMQFDYLQKVGITHIVCVRYPGNDVYIRTNFPEHFRYFLTLQFVSFVKSWMCINGVIIIFVCSFNWTIICIVLRSTLHPRILCLKILRVLCYTLWRIDLIHYYFRILRIVKLFVCPWLYGNSC